MYLTIKRWLLGIAILIICLSSGLNQQTVQARNLASFRMAIPLAPVPVSPISAIYTPRPTFIWNAVRGATTYWLYVDSGVVSSRYTPTQVKCPTATGRCSVTPAVNLRAGKHRWMVRAINASGSSPWSRIAYFSCTTPPPPVLTYPTTTVFTSKPYYYWNAIPGVTRYGLSVDGGRLSPTYTTTETHCSSGTGRCYVQPANVLTSGMHTWKMRAYNAFGYGLWSNTKTFVISQTNPETLVQTTDFEYLGAFRLPDDGERPRTFAYGGNAMTFNPQGDVSGSGDGFTGSLFVMGHDRLAYGELPNGGQVAEIKIPAPLISSNVYALPQATFIQGFRNVMQGHFSGLDEIPRVGMAYLNTPATGAKLHLAWGAHLQPETAVPSHAWFDLNLSVPNMRGYWYIGNQSSYSVNGYLFEIPTAWADANAGGKYLGTGRFRDGGWSGMGPSLYAYRSWVEGSGSPLLNGTHLQETVLLKYGSSSDTPNIQQNLSGYQHPDEWEGGAWITTSTGKTAVLFGGTKGTGSKYWYGFINPRGASYPCVAADFVGQFAVCRLADGTPCSGSDLVECVGHNDVRGWWASRFDAQFILYDPNDLARVASGQMAAWEPQPYTTFDLDEHLFLNPDGVEPEMLGTGVQRRFRIGDMAYDRANDILYSLELYAEGSKPVVHVWKVR
ncbi:MAG: hypothetical protein WCI88_14460 [Chloroflexota bacterium]